MTSKTKIVVLHLKELIRTGIFIGLGIIALILLIFLFTPDKKTNDTKDNSSENNPGVSSDTPNSLNDSVQTDSIQDSYIPGVYSTALVLGDHTVDVEVIVDSTHINSIRLVNLDEAITTMYPLLQPTFESLTSQIYEKQSLEGISYSDDSKYTSLVLLQAIETSLSKALDQTAETAGASLIQ